MSEWVKVEFYGLVPDGQALADVDTLTIAETLMRSFGFTALDDLRATKTERPPRLIPEGNIYWDR